MKRTILLATLLAGCGTKAIPETIVLEGGTLGAA